MKKIILPALLVGGLTLFSFTKSTNGGVNAAGKNLEQKATGLKFAQQNNTFTKNLGADYDLSKTELVESSTKNGIKDEMKRSWILKSKLSLSIFDANFLFWDNSTGVQDVAQVVKILEKYTNQGSIKKVGENLYNITTSAKFSDEDKQVLIDLIQKEYNLSDDEIKNGVVLSEKTMD